MTKKPFPPSICSCIATELLSSSTRKARRVGLQNKNTHLIHTHRIFHPEIHTHTSYLTDTHTPSISYRDTHISYIIDTHTSHISYTHTPIIRTHTHTCTHIVSHTHTQTYHTHTNIISHTHRQISYFIHTDTHITDRKRDRQRQMYTHTPYSRDYSSMSRQCVRKGKTRSFSEQSAGEPSAPLTSLFSSEERLGSLGSLGTEWSGGGMF